MLNIKLPALGLSLVKWKNSSAEQPKRTVAALSKQMTVLTDVSVTTDI